MFHQNLVENFHICNNILINSKIKPLLLSDEQKLYETENYDEIEKFVKPCELTYYCNQMNMME